MQVPACFNSIHEDYENDLNSILRWFLDQGKVKINIFIEASGHPKWMGPALYGGRTFLKGKQPKPKKG